MELVALSSATLVALASTIFFLLAIKTWSAFAHYTIGSHFPKSIMVEAAQRYRDEFAKHGREQSIYMASGLMFAVVFFLSVLLHPDGMFTDIPIWQHIIVVVLLAIVITFLTLRLTTIVFARRQLSFIKDANIATGHSLQKLTANKNRVFHDVHCSGVATIDNVVIGLHGVYTVSVIARRPGQDNRIRLKDDQLVFADKEAMSVQRSGVKSARLAKEIRKITGNNIRVRSVIAVPGWEVDSQDSNDYLLVNERNVVMLTGWRDEKDHLLNEDVETICNMLTERCTRFAS